MSIALDSSLVGQGDQHVRGPIHTGTVQNVMNRANADQTAHRTHQMLQLISIGLEGARLICRHPALELGWVPASMLNLLPRDAGIYVLLAPASGLAYIGESTNIRQRVPASLQRLPFALLIVYAQPLGQLVWDSPERLALEATLIERLRFAKTNANSGRLGNLTPSSTKLINETAGVIESVTRGLMPIDPKQHMNLITQGQRVRDIVMTTRDAPLTIAALQEHLQACGHPLTGATIGKTLRRDLCDPKRGGNQQIRITGPWSDPTSLIYVSGRRYASGWQKT